MSVHRSSWVAGLGLALCVVAATAAQARPLTPAEERDTPFSGIVPPCTDPVSLTEIQQHFAQSESEYWHSGLTIAAYETIKEIGFRSNGLDYIPRRYCVAHVRMSDQKVRTMSYSIVEAGGSIGYDDGVVFCVNGLDRNDAFAPACKMARP